MAWKGKFHGINNLIEPYTWEMYICVHEPGVGYRYSIYVGIISFTLYLLYIMEHICILQAKVEAFDYCLYIKNVMNLILKHLF